MRAWVGAGGGGERGGEYRVLAHSPALDGRVRVCVGERGGGGVGDTSVYSVWGRGGSNLGRMRRACEEERQMKRLVFNVCWSYVGQNDVP